MARLQISDPRIRMMAVRIFQLALDLGQGKIVLDDERYKHVDVGEGLGATSAKFPGGNMVQGRKSQHTCASCVYLACRRNKQPVMLIEVADAVGANVFELGRSYLRLAHLLRFDGEPDNGGVLEPSLYIQRFAKLLDFGEETNAVVEDALRLCTRFKHDWLASGRRPSGISGACLLIAARMNNFRRSVAEIVQVAKVADATLKKRLDEFAKLPAASLSIQEFRAVAEKEQVEVPGREIPLPPSIAENQAKERERLAGIRRARRKKERQKWDKAREEYGLGSDFELDEEGEEEELSEDESSEEEPANDAPGTSLRAAGRRKASEPEEAEAEPPTAAGGSPAAAAAEASLEETLTAEMEELLESNELKDDLRQEEERLERVAQMARLPSADRPSPRDKERSMAHDLVEGVEASASEEASTSRKRTPEAPTHGAEDEEDAVAGLLAMRAGPSPDPPDDKRTAKEARREAKRAEKLKRKREEIVTKRQQKRRKREERREAERLLAEKEGPDPLAGLNEEELDDYLLNEEESKVKTRIWTEFNKDWLQEQLQKQLQEEADIRMGIDRKPVKPRKQKEAAILRDSKNPMGVDAVDSATKFLKKKLPKSTKINYAALDSMMRAPSASFPGGTKGPRSESPDLSEAGASEGAKVGDEGPEADVVDYDEDDGYDEV